MVATPVETQSGNVSPYHCVRVCGVWGRGLGVMKAVYFYISFYDEIKINHRTKTKQMKIFPIEMCLFLEKQTSYVTYAQTPSFDHLDMAARTAPIGRAPKTAVTVRVKLETWTGRRGETRPSTRS